MYNKNLFKKSSVQCRKSVDMFILYAWVWDVKQNYCLSSCFFTLTSTKMSISIYSISAYECILFAVISQMCLSSLCDRVMYCNGGRIYCSSTINCILSNIKLHWESFSALKYFFHIGTTRQHIH